MKAADKDAIILEKLTAITGNEQFFDYLLGEAFKSVDKSGSGLVTTGQLREVLLGVAQDLKIPQPSAKDVESIIDSLCGHASAAAGVSELQFKQCMREYVRKMCENLRSQTPFSRGSAHPAGDS